MESAPLNRLVNIPHFIQIDLLPGPKAIWGSEQEFFDETIKPLAMNYRPGRAA